MLSPTNYYKVGGSLKYTHPTYVKREGDRLLIDALRNRDFCYVLNSRQMGKSSLRVQVTKQLEKEGLKCASIDLNKISSYATQDGWYQGFASELLRGFRLRGKVKLDHWWQEHTAANPVQCLGELIEDVLLAELSQTLVIFVDEIDSMIKLEFKDDFFAFIRACYNQRVDNQDYERLTFCLLGVATPSDLIQDRNRTPFNIGKSIELTGFSLDEAKEVLIPGFKNRVENPEQVLAEVLKWTGGQPFLTQKLCQIIVKNNDSCTPDVAELIKTGIIDNWDLENQDNPIHLRTIRDRLLEDEKWTSRLLRLYKQVLDSIPKEEQQKKEQQKEEQQKPTLSKKGLGGIAANQSYKQMKLRLTGLVVKHQNKLQVANDIYKEVFYLQWVEQKLAKLCRDFYFKILRIFFVGLVIIGVIGVIFQRVSLRRVNTEVVEKIVTSKKLAESGKNYEALLQALKAIKQLPRPEDSCKNNLNSFFGGSYIPRFILDKICATYSYMASNPIFQPHAESKVEVKNNLRQVVHIVNEKSYRQLKNLERHKNSVNGVAFSPDGETIATASDDNTVKLWNRQGKLLQTLSGHENSVNDVAFSPDEETIATASDDNTVKLWNRQGSLLQTLSGYENSVNGVAFSPNGEIIATTSDDNTVKLWNLQDQLLQALTTHENSVNGVTFSPDGETIATASDDKTVKLWDLKATLLQTLSGHENSVNSVAFSPDGETIATTSVDKTVKLWNRQGKLLQTLSGHENSVNSVAFSPDGETIATISGDKTVKLWNRQGSLLETLGVHENSVNGVAFSPDGETIATASDDNTVKLWNRQNQLLQTLTHHENSVNSVALSPDGETIATASDDNTVKLWNRQGKLLQTLTGHDSWVNGVAFSPDGETIATASDDNTVKLWNRQGKLLQTLTGHDSWVNGVAFSPDGETIATASDDNTVKLWNRQGKLLQTLTGHDSWVNGVAFSPDGETIATASDDNTVTLWNCQGSLLQILIDHESSVNGVAFSPDGETIATASDDNTVKLWNRQGKLLQTLTGHESSVNSVTFSPDGETIATASNDKTVKLWNRQGKLLQTLTGHDNWVNGVAFSPDGETIATASDDNTVKLWNGWQFDRLHEWACNWMGDYLENNPDLSKSDKHLCDDVGNEKLEVRSK
ncbi:AAA-like domain-containing protein [Okeania sp. SIO3B5]|uniref:WD40 domain-containing protein n=1 Tax=Okeania sp. SIO3B5 TaxID=2607811 RepID=UPI0025D91E40|nr:AAA-like domain-containing protein [Okeania sp. SIO3B5]